jgi:hypothetical protein
MDEDYKEPTYNSLGSLLNFKQPEVVVKKRKPRERDSFIEFFVEVLRNKDGNKFPIKTIIFKLSHIQTKDLYYVKSVFEDNLRRKGLEGASKEFWWSLKVQK